MASNEWNEAEKRILEQLRQLQISSNASSEALRQILMELQTQTSYLGQLAMRQS